MSSSKPQVVVTGASGGIGRATAQAFGARGAKVALLARGAAPRVLGRRLDSGHLDRQQVRTRNPGPLPGPDRLPVPADRPTPRPAQPANLWEPADGPQGRDFDTHGIFDATSTSRSYQLWASQHHGLFGAVGAGAAALCSACWSPGPASRD
ncbi:MAG TPA: SDR family NAD(P)-dependent oxidoreductase [Pseudonocardiaceae bacterium]|nr:SDR family NAD(P)-dependent oxidoreductase [Pseudonocardiaceae bacterium]